MPSPPRIMGNGDPSLTDGTLPYHIDGSVPKAFMAVAEAQGGREAGWR